MNLPAGELFGFWGVLVTTVTSQTMGFWYEKNGGGESRQDAPAASQTSTFVLFWALRQRDGSDRAAQGREVYARASAARQPAVCFPRCWGA